MSVRLMIAIACLLFAADLLFLAPLGLLIGWRFLALQSLLTAAMGLLVIAYYEWRWAGVIAERFDGEYPEPLSSGCLQKVFLVVAAVFLILPGALSDVIGLMLLAPPVRRLAARALPRCQAAATTE